MSELSGRRDERKGRKKKQYERRESRNKTDRCCLSSLLVFFYSPFPLVLSFLLRHWNTSKKNTSTASKAMLSGIYLQILRVQFFRLFFNEYSQLPVFLRAIVLILIARNAPSLRVPDSHFHLSNSDNVHPSRIRQSTFYVAASLHCSSKGDKYRWRRMLFLFLAH